MGHGIGLGWLVWRDCYLSLKKAHASLSHPDGLLLSLFLCLLFSGKASTACRAPAVKVWFSLKLQRHAMLSVDCPLEEDSSPVIQVTWRKCGDKPSRILNQVARKSPEYFGGYSNRTRYYFENNTLILDNVFEEDEGAYEVSLYYENTSVLSKTLHLHLIRPPPDPSIKVDTNNSHATLVLRCEVESGMNLSYHWLKSGQLLPKDERYSLVERNLTLQVNNLTSADCVNYTCVAANSQVWSEGHIQLNGSVIGLCSDGAPAALTFKGIMSIAVAAACVFGVCVMILCVRRRQEIWRWLKGRNSTGQPANSRSGQRDITDEANVAECPVYDEIVEEQISSGAQEVVQLTCVYTDFIPNSPGTRSTQRPVQIEDYGYSTIEPLEPVTPLDLGCA